MPSGEAAYFPGAPGELHPADSPVPGVVLVHGGGGTAFSEWVTEWTNRGYAAISIAVEGQTDSTTPPTIDGFVTIEAHSSKAPTEEESYTLSDLFYRGMNLWGCAPLKDKQDNKKVWEGKYWRYHYDEADFYSETDREGKLHKLKANQLFAEECRLRNRPVVTPDQAIKSFSSGNSWMQTSGLELFGFARWIEPGGEPHTTSGGAQP